MLHLINVDGGPLSHKALFWHCLGKKDESCMIFKALAVLWTSKQQTPDEADCENTLRSDLSCQEDRHTGRNDPFPQVAGWGQLSLHLDGSLCPASCVCCMLWGLQKGWIGQGPELEVTQSRCIIEFSVLWHWSVFSLQNWHMQLSRGPVLQGQAYITGPIVWAATCLVGAVSMLEF